MEAWGAAAGDLNNDGWPDLYIMSIDAKDQLYLNNQKGGFTTQDSAVFHQWSPQNGDDWPAGVALGDVDRDGGLDIVVGHHFDSSDDGSPESLRLFLNEGNGRFRHATSAAKLPKIASKSPHVEFQDFDNDGFLDIYASVHVNVGGRMAPLVLWNLAKASPEFRATSTTVQTSYGIGYAASGPTVDYDRDGRLDIFMPEWNSAYNSVLYRNTSKAGNFIDVQVRPDPRECNTFGIGARIEVFDVGAIGDPTALIARTEIMSGFGYSSGQAPIAHVGIADRTAVDIRVTLPHDGRATDSTNVKANQLWTAD